LEYYPSAALHATGMTGVSRLVRVSKTDDFATAEWNAEWMALAAAEKGT